MVCVGDALPYTILCVCVCVCVCVCIAACTCAKTTLAWILLFHTNAEQNKQLLTKGKNADNQQHQDSNSCHDNANDCLSGKCGGWRGCDCFVCVRERGSERGEGEHMELWRDLAGHGIPYSLSRH